MRTLWLGLLFGLTGGLLVLAAIALVEHGQQARLAPGLAAGEESAARRVLPPLGGIPEWRVVARVDTPWGSSIRLRPFLAGIEVRGVDCLLEGRADGGPLTARMTRDPAGIDWPALELCARALSRTAAKTLLPADAGEAPVSPVPHLALGARATESWSVEVETSLPAGALARGLAALPWIGEAPDLEPGAPLDLRVTLDPATFAPVALRDLRFRAEGGALVFDPNPVATSGRGDLRDGDPVDDWRVFTPVPRLDGSGYLRGTHAEVVTDQPPRAREAGFFYAYPSVDPRFEEAMAYVHADRALERVAELGFGGLFAAPLRLRVHGTAADNSWYSRPAREIVLGDGGVDDAEDADIILHELGHALHDALVPGFGDGDTRAISEGFSDFWAASLTGDPCIGDWDATSYSPPCLRRVDEPATWPAWLNGRVHHDGAIWSALLWDLRTRLGRETAERLALAALMEQSTHSTWPEAAAGLLRAAARLGLDPELPVIRDALAARGLGPRESEFSLAREEEAVFELIAPGRFAGHDAGSLVVQGDGQIRFVSSWSRSKAGSAPPGSPSVAPLGAEAWSPALRLDGRAILDGSRVGLELRWHDGTRELARATVSWESLEGWIEWEYTGAEGGGAAGLYAGASVGSLDQAAMPAPTLGTLPADGLEGLSAFHVPLDGTGGEPGLSALLGARFRLESDPSTPDLLRLRARTRPLPIGAGDALAVAVHPNPCRGPATIRLRLREPSHVSIGFYDAHGRRVGTIPARPAEAGVVTFDWEGRDDRGEPLPSGVYWVRAEGGGGSGVERLVVIR